MKISIVIITYNRWEELRKTLNVYLNQTYKDIELIVIDNASVDGTKEKLPLEFPMVKYLYLPDNIDIKAANIGMSLAHGEIIWRSDDDSHPLNNDCLEKVASIFEKHNNIDIIATEMMLPKANNHIVEWYPFKIDKNNVPDEGYKSNYFMGGGVAIRKKVFDTIGGFWGFGHEELDFSTRAILSNFNIRYYPNIISVHNAAQANRGSSWRWIQMSKQHIRYQFKYFSFIRAVVRANIISLITILQGIYQKRNPIILFECVTAMFYSGLTTLINEHQPIKDKNKFNEITLKNNIFKSEFRYIKTSIIAKLKKSKKNI
ncbi:MAG: glycosyltransferase [Bacteroidetes bacterium]|nr:glycosyltransferase [Bacteroidota bacterium]MBR3090863.1 glycosyltransferase [Bacteroidota bacterium]